MMIAAVSPSEQRPHSSCHSTGKERDAETGLDYFGARYFSGAQGRFTSTDPLNVPNLQVLDQKRFVHFITNPQNWNAYSYSLNDPINKLDPDGFLTIVVPGTNYNPQDWTQKNPVVQQAAKTFGETPVVLQWSGANTNEARTAAAGQLKALIANHTFASGETLNIVAHSHGGNVAIEAGNSSNHKIDNFITLGTPVRDDYRPNASNIGHWVNIYSTHDAVQVRGGHGDRFCWGQGQCGPAGRTFPSATNVDSGINMGPLDSHSDLWRKPEYWKTNVDPKYRVQVTK
jgi:RHS repeat-associated protein